MEYVKVTFPTSCRVLIDGEENGDTNEVLRIDAGTHVFGLSGVNCRPVSQKVMIENTTVLQPKEVAFLQDDAR